MSDVTENLDDYDAFFWPHLVRFRAWMRRPDLASPISSRVGVDIAPRGAAWALVSYLADVYGASDPSAFVRRLVAGPEVGRDVMSAFSGGTFPLRTDTLPGDARV